MYDVHAYTRIACVFLRGQLGRYPKQSKLLKGLDPAASSLYWEGILK